MQLSKINLVYFSATYTTRKVVRLIARETGKETTEYDITQHAPDAEILSAPTDLLVVGMPVYAGRIPARAAEAISRFKGSLSPAIIVCVYGNRDYDDALLELKDIVERNGFKAIAAGAFIAQHSIFPSVGAHRPDEDDIRKIRVFAAESLARLRSVTGLSALPELPVKGNRPYKIPGKIPLTPKGNRKCDCCGVCVRNCPVQAIPPDAPRHTLKEICLSCGRCIAICPQHARHFGGLLYKIAARKFTRTHTARKEPEWVVIGT